jgi:hypothetical protein
VEVDDPVSQEELARLAIKLRNDLFDYEDKLGSCRDFGELKNSAGMLVVAILEPVEFRLTAPPPKKTAQECVGDKWAICENLRVVGQEVRMIQP